MKGSRAEGERRGLDEADAVERLEEEDGEDAVLVGEALLPGEVEREAEVEVGGEDVVTEELQGGAEGDDREECFFHRAEAKASASSSRTATPSWGFGRFAFRGRYEV